jgi:hypothetical protein
MTKFAQLLLVLTSLAPIGLLQAAVSFDHHQKDLAEALVCVTVLLVIICEAMLRGLKYRKGTVPRDVKDPVPKEAEPLAFLVAYALPLVSVKDGSASLMGLLVFGVLMTLAAWQLQLIYINPLLAILGYSFVSVKTADGTPATIITRQKSVRAGVLNVVEISDYLWIDHPTRGA